MTCLTENQIAQIALRLDDIESLESHVEQCPACRSKLADMRRITDQLAAMHSEVGSLHAASRARLLAQLSTIDVPIKRAGVRKWLVRQLDRLTINQRVAAGGVGLTTVVGLVLLVIVWSSAERLSAMERMVKQLREVTSFSFELEETSDRITGENKRRIQRNDTNYWRSPASWRGTTKLVKLPLPPAPDDAGELLVDVEEIYTTGERGILIDHKGKTFFRTPEMQPDAFPDYSPVNWVQRMSKGSVKVLSDLGTKQLQGKTAHGYIVSLGHPEADSGQNAVHLWVDTETDLPIEFSFEDRDSSETVDAWTNVMRVFNCQWNIDLEADLFEPTEPLGYDDTSWPQDDKAVEDIVQALRLYAELSGGHYPQVTEFHGDAIQAEMLKLAASAEAPQSDSDREKRFQQIQQAKTGLDLITRTLRNIHHTGYYGTEVGPSDKDKILIWWPVDVEDLYRVIYGDLRTELLPQAEWSKLVPPKVAESHAPVEYSKPDAGR